MENKENLQPQTLREEEEVGGEQIIDDSISYSSSEEEYCILNDLNTFQSTNTDNNSNEIDNELISQRNNSTNQQNFPQSIEEATSFLKQLLKAYYAQKHQESLKPQKLIEKSKNIPLNEISIRKPYKKKTLELQRMKAQSKQLEKTRGVQLFSLNKYIIAIFLLSIFGLSFSLGQSHLNQQKLNEINIQQSIRINELVEEKQSYEEQKQLYEEKHQKAEQKIIRLNKVINKAILEEKRNCNLIDIYSIIKSSFGSKKQENLTELCRYYNQYLELEQQQEQNSEEKQQLEEQEHEEDVNEDEETNDQMNNDNNNNNHQDNQEQEKNQNFEYCSEKSENCSTKSTQNIVKEKIRISKQYLEEKYEKLSQLIKNFSFGFKIQSNSVVENKEKIEDEEEENFSNTEESSIQDNYQNNQAEDIQAQNEE